MKFELVAWYFEQIEKTTLRNEKTKFLAELLTKASPNETQIIVYLAISRLVPLYVPLEFGMAEKSLIKTVAWASKRPIEDLEKEYKLAGDLGEVISKNSESGSLQVTLEEVYQHLLAVAKLSGKGSQDGKVQLLSKLLTSLAGNEAKYIVRLVAGKLRLGFSDMTILDSLSWARVGSKQDREKLEYAYNVSSDIGLVARLYMGGVDISTMLVSPGVPVRPMRAERLGTMKEIIEKLGECAVEPKLDGMRVQVHAYSLNDYDNQITRFDDINTGAEEVKQNGFFDEVKDDVRVKIYSRGLEDITAMFPEVVEAASKLYKRVGPYVLDGEAIGVRADGSFLPFQETMKRKRKYGISEQLETTPLKVYVFDTLYAKNEDTLRKSYCERREILKLLLSSDTNAVFVVADSEVVKTEGEMQQLFDKAMERKLEGILVKKLDSVYRAGARDSSWVKYKRAHESELADTIDAVVMGAYVGKGKRQKFGVGAFLVGIRDGEKIVTVAKIGTGLSDEQFHELYTKLKTCQVESSSSVIAYYDVPKNLEPDIWVEPSIIVEIEADEITESPLHTAGLALRFPRLIRFRVDKLSSDITTKEELEKLFQIGRA